MANRVYSGKYTGEETVDNPLADSQLVKRQSGYGKAYGKYESYSIGQRPGYRKPAPAVQDKGNVTDAD